MSAIHQNCLETANKRGAPGSHLSGANIVGFSRIARAMTGQVVAEPKSRRFIANQR